MDEQSESSEESEEEKPPEEDKEEEEEKKAPTPQEKKRRKGGLAPLSPWSGTGPRAGSGVSSPDAPSSGPLQTAARSPTARRRVTLTAKPPRHSSWR